MANDKPLLVIFEDRLYFPVFETVLESEYGGEFKTEAEYRDGYVRELIENKGSIDIGLHFVLTDFCPVSPTEKIPSLLGKDGKFIKMKTFHVIIIKKRFR